MTMYDQLTAYSSFWNRSEKSFLLYVPSDSMPQWQKTIVVIEYQFLFCRSVDNWENESDYVAENLKWLFLIVLNLPSSQLSYFLHFIWFYFSLIVIGRNQLENQMHDELVFWYIFFYPFHLWAENILGAHNW